MTKPYVAMVKAIDETDDFDLNAAINKMNVYADKTLLTTDDLVDTNPDNKAQNALEGGAMAGKLYCVNHQV